MRFCGNIFGAERGTGGAPRPLAAPEHASLRRTSS
jgi:hypothetical protein